MGLYVPELPSRERRRSRHGEGSKVHPNLRPLGQGGRMRILVIEDDELLGPMLVRSLRRRGHSTVLVTTLNSARQFLDEVASLPEQFPECILTDRELPDGDGWDYVDALTLFEGRRIHMSGRPKEPVPYEYFYKGHDTLQKLYQLIEQE